MNPSSPEFRNLVNSITTTKLVLPKLNGNGNNEVKGKDGFTGYKDTDTLILMQMSDREIAAICSVNKYINSICENQYFWLNRMITNLRKTCVIVRKIPEYNDADCSIFEGNFDKINKYLGFTNYREMNNFFAKFTKGEQLSIFFHIVYSRPETLHFENLFNRIYKINKNKLPKFINYVELVYYLRRNIIEEYYHMNKEGPNVYSQYVNVEGLEYNVVTKGRKLADHEQKLRSIDF